MCVTERIPSNAGCAGYIPRGSSVQQAAEREIQRTEMKTGASRRVARQDFLSCRGGAVGQKAWVKH